MHIKNTVIHYRRFCTRKRLQAVRNTRAERNNMDKELETTGEIIEEVVEKIVKPKDTRKKFEVKLVTNTSIIYDDNGVSRFVPKKGFEDLKIGDTFKI